MSDQTETTTADSSADKRLNPTRVHLELAKTLRKAEGEIESLSAVLMLADKEWREANGAPMTTPAKLAWSRFLARKLFLSLLPA